MSLNVVFRVDAGRQIGSGHVVRCLTLANALRGRGARVSFVCREHEGHYCDLIEGQGFFVKRLKGFKKITLSSEKNNYSYNDWLGVSWLEDAIETIDYIGAMNAKPDWLVIDHYAIEQDWEKKLRPFVGRVMIVDDLANRSHDCDLLLDQNLIAHMNERYNTLVPPSCKLLLGPQYALLQPEYAALHDSMIPRDGSVRRILIFFGGSADVSLTECAIDAFLKLGRNEICIDVVMPQKNEHSRFLSQKINHHKNIQLHDRVPSLAGLMAKADLAVGGGGTTTWERICLMLPTLVITLAENQLAIADELSRLGLIELLGDKDEVDISMIEKAMSRFIKDGPSQAWYDNCSKVVDGKGTNRVCNSLIESDDIVLKIREATSDDESLLLDWANDPIVRYHSFSSDPIPAETHKEWFSCRLKNKPSCYMYIAETKNGIPVGQVRFDLEGLCWKIDYSLSKNFRGLGLAKKLLRLAFFEFHKKNPNGTLIGQVKRTNRPSQRIFNALGFKLEEKEGILEYRYFLEAEDK